MPVVSLHGMASRHSLKKCPVQSLAGMGHVTEYDVICKDDHHAWSSILVLRDDKTRHLELSVQYQQDRGYGLLLSSRVHNGGYELLLSWLDVAQETRIGVGG